METRRMVGKGKGKRREPLAKVVSADSARRKLERSLPLLK
jgi:hypothetical protein